ncbi:MAG: heavy metal-associated domain-containing protein [Crocinitomicaceae bacterium]
MKNVLVMVFALLTLTAFGQKKVGEIVIHTTAECESCKERLEGKLNYTVGIKFADLDIPTKNLTVKYTTAKISLEEIKKIISDLGYDADDVKANPEAYEALPTCCKVNGMEHSEQE